MHLPGYAEYFVDPGATNLPQLANPTHNFNLFIVECRFEIFNLVRSLQDRPFTIPRVFYRVTSGAHGIEICLFYPANEGRVIDVSCRIQFVGLNSSAVAIFEGFSVCVGFVQRISRSCAEPVIPNADVNSFGIRVG